MQHTIDDLIALFNQLFTESENTVLIAGDDEPIYLPADETHEKHRIIFANRFFSSALHEISHWCIAGEKRRQQVDYGYWYNPDGRSASQQMEFAKVEAKPQALEWIFSQACGHPFVISLDNLEGEPIDITPFRQAVLEQIHHFQQHGIGARAEKLQQALSNYYQQATDYRKYQVSLQELK